MLQRRATGRNERRQTVRRSKESRKKEGTAAVVEVHRMARRTATAMRMQTGPRRFNGKEAEGKQLSQKACVTISSR